VWSPTWVGNYAKNLVRLLFLKRENLPRERRFHPMKKQLISTQRDERGCGLSTTLRPAIYSIRRSRQIPISRSPMQLYLMCGGIQAMTPEHARRPSGQ